VSREVQEQGGRVSKWVEELSRKELEQERAKKLRQQLDEVSVAFQLCRWATQRPETWLKAVRTAIGLSAVEMAKRLGVVKWDVYKMEKSEEKASIQIGTLRRAAEAMGCELVYALVPKVGSIASLAAREREAARAAEEERLAKRLSERERQPSRRLEGDELNALLRTLMK
jgi:predicted DNA-binding mobile mystery protein A